jgi:CYTH domain-containing protein
MKLEIERKFLLKAMPEIEPTEKITIEQWYWKNNSGTWERARTWHSNINGKSWIHTIKKSVSKGVNIEDEKELTEQEFKNFVSKCKTEGQESRFISKQRWIYPQGDLKWEVDKFDKNHCLIIAEIEIPKKSFKVDIPDFIKDKLIVEVTGIKQFSNRNLSNKI